jgi:hypothetical protein
MSTPFLDITADHVDKSPATRWLNSQWDFVRSHLPPAPARVIDIGCGPHGGFMPAPRHTGYDAAPAARPGFQTLAVRRCLSLTSWRQPYEPSP